MINPTSESTKWNQTFVNHYIFFVFYTVWASLMFTKLNKYWISSVQSISHVWHFVPHRHSTPGFTVYHQLPKLAQTHVYQVSDAIQPSYSLSSLLLLPPIPPSIRAFSNESALLIRWPKYRNFSFNISPSNEYSGLISFRIGWLDLLAVQGTLKRLLQHHRSKASILWCSVFFILQLSHPCMTTGKSIAFTSRPLLEK